MRAAEEPTLEVAFWQRLALTAEEPTLEVAFRQRLALTTIEPTLEIAFGQSLALSSQLVACHKNRAYLCLFSVVWGPT